MLSNVFIENLNKSEGHRIERAKNINHSDREVEYRYYISSIESSNVEKIASLIRSHWKL